MEVAKADVPGARGESQGLWMWDFQEHLCTLCSWEQGLGPGVTMSGVEGRGKSKTCVCVFAHAHAADVPKRACWLPPCLHAQRARVSLGECSFMSENHHPLTPHAFLGGAFSVISHPNYSITLWAWDAQGDGNV